MLIALALFSGAAAHKLAGVAWAQTTDQSSELIEQGRRIYEAGQLGSGEPLRADRGEHGIAASGRAAACINCHQRSGFGLFEATNLVPPVTGPSLFSNAQPRSQPPRRAKGIEHQEFSFLTRPPYDALSLVQPCVMWSSSCRGHACASLLSCHVHRRHECLRQSSLW